MLIYRQSVVAAATAPPRLRRRGSHGETLTWGAALAVLMGPRTVAATSGMAFGRSAQTVKLSAKMNARQVVPHKPKGVARASGTFTGTLTGSGSRSKLSWKITYSKLDHPSIVIADIHYGKPAISGR